LETWGNVQVDDEEKALGFLFEKDRCYWKICSWI